eukprot:comp19281_c0_seq1/m.22108 comp19281_c0_seq1/g.22108  ORF comp19281_c0_seq1/g.22108 comp19281_c0_seq1/m.22108 type:complete len:364 (-) comp19281_c0_seq1:298-1389(-)
MFLRKLSLARLPSILSAKVQYNRVLSIRMATMADKKKNLSYPGIDKNGTFKNPWDTWREKTFMETTSFLMTPWKNKIPSKEELDKRVPILPIDKQKISNPAPGAIQFTWIGHATCFVQMNGLNIITDPMFSHHSAPVPIFGSGRYRDPPCELKELPNIDIVVVSHDHFDHLDIGTVKKLGNGPKWYVPLKVGAWLAGQGITNVVEMNWWDEVKHNDSVTVACVPAQHWCTRNLLDKNVRLWAGFVVIGKAGKFYFAGDTGYCPAFKEIGEVYGPIDLSAIPIGAYTPRHFMQQQHIDPPEAVLVHQNVKSINSIGMHWGTFQLTDEAPDEPPMVLKEALTNMKASQEEFICIKHGETYVTHTQ